MSAFSCATITSRTSRFQVQRRQHRVVSKAGSHVQSATTTSSRRELMQQAAILAAGAALQASFPTAARAAEPTGFSSPASSLCDEGCLSAIAAKAPVTTSTGLAYHDIVVGEGAEPPVGYQVVVNYVAMTADGKVFANSVEDKKPYDIRVGAGQIIAGLDEGLLSMKSGGIRRLYIPGTLAFPKGLASAPGRPRVPPNTPVLFDVQLLYVPGLDD